MNRRTFLASLGATTVFQGQGHEKGGGEAERTGLTLLSREGSGRATGYAEANKIVTVGHRTHLAWLDSPKTGFKVRLRTLDHHRGEWSPVYEIGKAHDNHGGPALTCDQEGYLHLVYFPHHHSMRYRRSTRPNDASAWTEEIRFGENLTYPTLLCGADGTLWCSARRSHRTRPWEIELWKREPGRDWARVGSILKARFNGYAHFQESLAWGPDHRTLHLGCRIHEKSDADAYGRIQTVGYLKSDDFGHSWTHFDGTPVSGVASADTIESLAAGGADQRQILRAGAIAVDPTNGIPQVIYSVSRGRKAQTFLAIPSTGGIWERVDLARHRLARPMPVGLTLPGGLTFDEAGTLHGTLQTQNLRDGESNWGHPSNEVLRFRRHRAGDFEFLAVSRPDPNTPHWLPSLERRTGFNKVIAPPGISFTAGPAGRKNTNRLNNRVYFQQGPGKGAPRKAWTP